MFIIIIYKTIKDKDWVRGLVVESLTSMHEVLEIIKIKNLLQARDPVTSGGKIEEKQDSNIV